jgi:ribosomal protein L7Ae-like RNA K-turn-binding protein
MVSELHEFVKKEKVVFGVRETTKHAKKLSRVFVASDCRNDIADMLKQKGLNVEFLEMPKNELMDKLALDFTCEVFGVKK